RHRKKRVVGAGDRVAALLVDADQARVAEAREGPLTLSECEREPLLLADVLDQRELHRRSIVRAHEGEREVNPAALAGSIDELAVGPDGAGLAREDALHRIAQSIAIVGVNR